MRDLLNDLNIGWSLSDPDPVRRAQIQMRTPLPKRFYKSVDAVPGETGYRIALDGKIARTPNKAELVLPTHTVGAIVVAEFEAQKDLIDPVTMPVTRLANTAIDGVANEIEAVRDDIVRFASSDLLCYRADAPEGLVSRQNRLWNPVLHWVESALGRKFRLAEGVVYVAQPPETVACVASWLNRRAQPMRLASLHLMTTLTGSAILAMACEAGAISADDAWSAAHVDEDWQIEQWGQDAEAVVRRNARRRDFDAAVDLVKALS